MNINCLAMHVVSMPLKQPFHTHLETVREREVIVIEAHGKDGAVGWGEASAFSTPWYTEETVQTEWHIIKDVLFPLLEKNPVHHPNDVHELFQSVRGNRMAKAGVEAAVWDLYARQQNKPLYDVLGGTQRPIVAGAACAGATEAEMLSQVEQFLKEGYSRIKVKIGPDSGIELLKAVRQAFPDVPLMADANAAFSLQDAAQLAALDPLQLMMIEQPLHHEDMWEHALLQKRIKTPVCLDESIRSFHDAKSAISMEACRVINVKYSRVGGHTEAVLIHDLAASENIPLWAGGMIELGISRAHTAALATLPGFTLPGDFVSGDHYWEEDLIEPGIKVKNGRYMPSSKPGIGVDVIRSRVEKRALSSFLQKK